MDRAACSAIQLRDFVSHFALQIGDDPAHRGLRIAEKFGRLRDVSQLYGFQKDLIFG